MAAELSRLWRRRAPYQTFAYYAGALLVASGLVHAVIFLIDGGPWAGPVGWRKPIVFGLSLGVTTIFLSWFMSYVRVRPGTGWILMGMIAVCSVVEYVLITAQAWRNVPSHFNDSTPLNEIIWIGMGVNIALVWIASLGVTVLVFRRFQGPPSLALGMRSALVLLFVGNLLGGVIIGNDMDAFGQRGAESSIFGAAGQIKVPHAVALHALQVLPIIAWVSSFADLSEDRRIRIVAVACVGYAGVVIVNVLQTFGGVAPLELSVVTGTLLLISAALLLVAVAATARSLVRPRAIA
jgi:hypothetical protein